MIYSLGLTHLKTSYVIGIKGNWILFLLTLSLDEHKKKTTDLSYKLHCFT